MASTLLPSKLPPDFRTGAFVSSRFPGSGAGVAWLGAPGSGRTEVAAEVLAGLARG